MPRVTRLLALAALLLPLAASAAEAGDAAGAQPGASADPSGDVGDVGEPELLPDPEPLPTWTGYARQPVFTPPGALDGSPPGTVLLSDADRWPHTSLVPRVFLDLVGIPANVPSWRADDWGRFALFAGVTGGLMLPLDPSPDARLDRWIVDELSWVPDIWGGTMQAFLWGGIAASGLVAWKVGQMNGHDRLAESMSLTLEAVSVAQLYHVTLKLLIGREGPMDGEGLGIVRGPAESLDLFPQGTPSGHFATLYSILSVATYYWRPAWQLQAVGHGVVGFLAAMHVINRRHFISDIVWGGAMGWYIGKWVVEHRSSLYAYEDGEAAPMRLVVAPFRVEDARGLMVAFTF